MARESKYHPLGAMMLNHDSDYIERAADYWRQGHPLEAGQLIYESQPTEHRPEWASKILKLAITQSGIQFPPVENVIHTAKNAAEWRKAHKAFTTVRNSTLELLTIEERTKEEELLLSLLGLAENVAKVIYNASNPQDPFDEDSGWWIAVALKDFLELVNDDNVSKSMWLALCCQGQ